MCVQRAIATTLVATSVLVFVGLVSPPAFANVGKVEDLLTKAGRSGVVRGPNTISKAQKAELEDIAASLSDRWGGRAYFVLLPSGVSHKAYMALYDSLEMGGADLLAVSNGKGLGLRCNGLPKQGKTKAWEAFRDADSAPKARFSALVAALPASLPRRAKGDGSGSGAAEDHREVGGEDADSSGSGAAIFAVLMIAAVAGVIWRRKRRDARLQADFVAALDPVETDLADMYLSMDGKEDIAGFNNLLSQATALSEKVDALKGEAPNRQAISKLNTLSRDAAWLKDQMKKMDA